MAQKNINDATYDDLKQVHSLSDEKVSDILEYLEDHRPISNLNELKNINGIKDDILDDLKESFNTQESQEDDESDA